MPKKKRSTENESEMESGFKTIRALGESIRGKNCRKEFIENVLTYDSSNTIDEGRKEVDSDIQDEFEKIHSEIFREIYINFFRGLKNPSSSDFMRKHDTVVFKENKKICSTYL